MIGKIKTIFREIWWFTRAKGFLRSDNLERWLKLEEGEVAIDCGAHVGKTTEKLAQMGAEVYAFEPNPYAFEVLSERMRHWPRVHCLNQAVWTEQGRQRLYLHQKAEEDQVEWASGSSLMPEKANVDKKNSVEVETIDLAEFVGSLGRRVGFLKMDIEGGEVKVLKKMIDSGAIELVDKIAVETHDDKYPEFREETEALRRRIEREGLRKIRMDWE